MLGLSKEELSAIISNLDQTKYYKIYNDEITKYSKLLKPSAKTSDDITLKISEFSNVYLEKIVKPLMTDLIDENNKKIEQDVRQIIAQYLR
ncbi:MAG: hypothetical protein K0Q53_1431 [Massilibacillus sp.]|jgi:hypothetical protein|nr:hypothetical protein [Massilibacillus sp.]